ncbi:MAG: hypothetical protein K9J13_14465 [Saprospiraceae bacterium]|nr:hypothetical protein [Saprospiraceae bacterium]
MKNKLNFLILLLVAIVISSCNVMYMPNMENVPLMQEKGDMKFNLSTTNAQASYAITDKLAVMANGYKRTNSWHNAGDLDSLNWEYKSDRFLVEGGLGYYKQLSEDVIFEVYGGGGFGQIAFDNFDLDFDLDRKFSANMTRYFVQPNIGYKNDYVEFAFSSRLTALKFSGITTQDYTIQELKNDDLFQLDVPTYFFFEPAFTIRLGYKWVKLHFQTLYSTKLNIDPLNYRGLGVNVGIYVDISKAYNK